MSEEALAPASDSAPAPVASTPAPEPTTSELTVSEAARLLGQRRRQVQAPVEQPKADPVEPELAQASSDPETDPAEVTTEVEPAEPPPIDPPRSWTQAEKERFQSLPRETQEYLHTREQEREREFRRGQNEIAEQRKAIAADREAAEQEKKTYQSKLPALMQALQDVSDREFPDIKSVADYERFAQEALRLSVGENADPFRALHISNYLKAFDAHQQKLAAINADLQKSENERQAAQQSEWTNHVQKENALAAEFIPELADKVKGPALTQRVASELLPELGFKDSELNELAAGKQKLSIYDHRVQRLLADALKLRDIQRAPKAVATRTIPPVQRPGAARTVNNGAVQQIQALQKQLETASGNKAAEIGAQLLRLRRAGR